MIRSQAEELINKYSIDYGEWAECYGEKDATRFVANLIARDLIKAKEEIAYMKGQLEHYRKFAPRVNS